MNGSQPQPLILLGERLKRLREAHKESVAEVSGAVEIEPDMLAQIEDGKLAPSEDILSLLINHFNVREREAVQLWEWAGLDRGNEVHGAETLHDLASKATLVLVALDARVMYTDRAVISGNESGVIMNFLQSGAQDQPLPVARIGMSYEQAERVLQTLQQTLLRQKYLPKNLLLPPGSSDQSSQQIL